MIIYLPHKKILPSREYSQQLTFFIIYNKDNIFRVCHIVVDKSTHIVLPIFHAFLHFIYCSSLAVKFRFYYFALIQGEI